MVTGSEVGMSLVKGFCFFFFPCSSSFRSFRRCGRDLMSICVTCVEASDPTSPRLLVCLQMEQVSDDELDHGAEEDSDKEDQDLDKMFGAWLGELDKLTQVKTHTLIQKRKGGGVRGGGLTQVEERTERKGLYP